MLVGEPVLIAGSDGKLHTHNGGRTRVGAGLTLNATDTHLCVYHRICRPVLDPGANPEPVGKGT